MKRVCLFILIACMALMTVNFTACADKGGKTLMGKDEDLIVMEKDGYGVIRNLLLDAAQTDFGEDVPSVGLKDPSAVGVNAQRFNGEEIAVINESEFAGVINAADYGVSANDGKDDSAALASAIAAAKEIGNTGKKVLLKLPAGRIDLAEGMNAEERDYGVSLLGVKNVAIVGENTQLVISGVMSGVHIVDCENLIFKGVSFDYARPPFSVGEIISSGEKQVVIAVKDNYPMDNITNVNDYLEFDKYTHMPRANGNFLLSSDIKNYVIEGQKITINFYSSINKPVNGTLAVVSHYTYGQNGFYIEDSKNLTLENIDLYTAAGMGLVGLASENITVNRFNVRLKPNTDRLMTTTADGMHFGACRGKLSVTNCLIENTHDDAINVKAGHYFGIGGINLSQRTVKLQKLNYMHRIAAGDEIRFYTAKLGYVCSIRIEEVLSFDGTGALVRADNIPAALNGELIAANYTTAPEFTFENNVVRNKRNRGVLLQTVNSVVKNNAFFNVGHGAVSVMTEASQFNEAIVPENVVIESNKFIGCNSMSDSVGGEIGIGAYGKEWISAPAGTIKNVTIKNNFIANTARRALSVTSAGGLNVYSNLIYNPALKANNVQNDCAIAVSESTGLYFGGNYILKEAPDEDFVTLFSDGTVPEEEFTLVNNKNLAFKEVDISVEPDSIFRLPAGTTIDMTAKNFGDFAAVDQTIRIVGFTDAYGKEVTLDENNFAVRMLKAAYDDNGIYIAFDIKDDELNFSPASSFWNGDLFELFFTPELKSTYGFPIVRTEYSDTAQIALTPSYLHVEPSRTSAKLQQRGAEAFTALCWKTSDGWAGKLAIDFSICTELKEIMQNNGEISMAIVLADMDEGADRIQVSNTAHNVENNKCIPLMMGKIKFD